MDKFRMELRVNDKMDMIFEGSLGSTIASAKARLGNISRHRKVEFIDIKIKLMEGE